MTWLRPALIPLLSLSLTPLRGDALDDLRGALRALKAQSSVTYEVRREGWEAKGSERTPLQGSFQVVDGPGVPRIPDEDRREVPRAHEVLLERLEEARLLEVRTEVQDGPSVRRVRIALSPDMDADARKHLKHFEHVAELWIGADGLPFRMEERLHMEIRVMLLLRVSTRMTDARTFVRRGDRLVLVTRDTAVEGKAMGKTFSGQEQLRAAPVPGA